MTADSFPAGLAYLQQLSDQDLELLAAGAPELAEGRGGREAIRSRQGLVEELLGRRSVFDLVFGSGGDDRGIAPVSPFLVFAVAVQRTRQELSATSYIEEWLGPRRRMPVWDVEPLRQFLDDPWRRLFLVELLSSYTRVSSGSVLVATRRGLRRQRFSDLDLVRLAGLLEVVPRAEHPGVYRRLGDLALFLTGVFPDHTAMHGISSVDESRLLRAGHLNQRARVSTAIAGFGEVSAVELIEQLGRRWYRLAYELVAPPVPSPLRAVGDLPERFGEARRILNLLTDRYLFPFRTQWFGAGGSGPAGG